MIDLHLDIMRTKSTVKWMGSLAVAACLLMVAFSCEKINDQNDDPDNPYQEIEITTKSADFVQKGLPFTFDYIGRINGATEENYIISPLSMQFLLGMILDGTRGETADEICTVLGYGKGEVDAVNEYCLSVLQQLPELDKKTTLSIANAIVVNQQYSLLDSYQATVGKYYEAFVSKMDFSDSDAAVTEINQWCSDHTGGMVPKVLERVSIDILCYLFNALYFKSEWKFMFDKSATSDEDFTNGAGQKVKVKMMRQAENYQYAENDIYQVVNLPYGNGAFSMMVFLPKSGYGISDVIGELKKADWNSLRKGMGISEVDLWLPRFETKFGIKLNDILIAMGMPLAFDDNRADFSAMSPDALCLSFVRQDAAIKVDEEGSEAAAVSSAGVFATSPGPTPHTVFHADHPFLYLITEASTGAVLFAGRYGLRD